MTSTHRLVAWAFGIFATLALAIHCDSTTVQAQREKTRQIEIQGAMMMYSYDHDGDRSRPWGRA